MNPIPNDRRLLTSRTLCVLVSSELFYDAPADTRGTVMVHLVDVMQKATFNIVSYRGALYRSSE